MWFSDSTSNFKCWSDDRESVKIDDTLNLFMQFVSGKWDTEDSYDEQENVDSLKWKTEVIENDRKYRIDRQRD